MRRMTRPKQRLSWSRSLAAGCLLAFPAFPAAGRSILVQPFTVWCSPDKGNLLSRSASMTGGIAGVLTAEVDVAWGPSDGGTTRLNWAQVMPVGAMTGLTFAAALGPLQGGQSYFCRAVARSDGQEVWQEKPAVFSTPFAWIKSVAHRGGTLLAPENTVSAFRSAQTIADFAEFDVQESKDGYLVVIHDDTVDRTTDGSGAVSNMTLSQLRSLDAGRKFSPRFTGEKIPTLEEALAAILPGMTPMVERKSGSPAHYVSALAALGVSQQVILTSFDWSFLSAVHALDPEIALAAIGDAAPLASNAAGLKAGGITNVMPNKPLPSQLATFHSHGLKTYVWTVNVAADARFFVSNNVDGIVTDNPLLVTRVVQEDGDGDALVDAWESRYWGDPTQTNGAGDADGDGLSDRAEFAAGTDPRDPGSRLDLRRAAPMGAGEMTLAWSSQPGRFYSLLSCPTPDGLWTVVVSGLPPSSPTNVYTLHSDDAQAFYRVRVER